MVSSTDDHGHQPGGHRHRGRHRDHPGGTSPTSAADQFTYTAAPAVTGLSPTSGPAAGGTSVTITGTGFTGATAVDFGTTAATSYTVVSNTDDHGHQPGGHRHRGRHRDHPGRHVGHLARRSVHLTARSDGHGREPDQRSGGRRHSVTITGTDFTGATAVDFGTTAATSSRWSATPTITATARRAPAPWT